MQHLTNAQLDTLLRGAPPSGERMAALAHVSGCTACAQALASRVMQQPCAATPPGFIPHTLALAQAKRRQESLRSYTLRVVAAMAAALVLLFTGAFKFLEKLPESMPQAVDTIQSQITDLTSNIYRLTSSKEVPHAPKPE